MERQAAAVRLFLRFFRFGILALEVGEGSRPANSEVFTDATWANFRVADHLPSDTD